MLAAIFDGFRRVASAPAVLLGTLVLTFLFAAPLDLSLSGVSVFTQWESVLAVLPFPLALYGAQQPAWLVIWAFLTGGILDRYARNRPTRGRGFFAACGAHFPAMIRLGVVEWLVALIAVRAGAGRYSGYVDVIIALAAGVFLYARVRIVVEDRRSALGALLAGGRFIRRNAGAIPLYMIFATAIWLAMWLEGPLILVGGQLTATRLAGSEIMFTALLVLVFASWASAISFFQSRLAHASYTAGPPLEWPESPAAEAITRLAPSPRT